MARSPSRILSEATVTVLYGSEKDIPWDELEAAVAGALNLDSWHFSKAERHEVFRCTETYSEALGDASGGLTKKSLERARTDILKLLRFYQHVFDRYLKPERDAFRSKDISLTHVDGSDDRGARVEAQHIPTALHMKYSTEGFSVHRALLNFGNFHDLARELRHHLEQPPQIDSDDLNFFEESARDPKLVALEAFIEEVWRGASGAPARRNPSNSERPKIFEYSRWGIPVGPQSAVFQRFTNVLLKENYSQPAIRQAFENLRATGFQTLSEVVTREVNKEE